MPHKPSHKHERQRIEKVGRRRARLTAVEGTISDADAWQPSEDDVVGEASDVGTGPNDERLSREKPPHY